MAQLVDSAFQTINFAKGAPDLAPGKPIALPCQIGDYQLLEKLGEGSIGQVFLAHHDPSQKKVALKVVFKENGRAANDKRTCQIPRRTLREVDAMCKLDDDRIVKIHDFFETPSCYCLVMQFIVGRSLLQLVRETNESGGRLDPVRVVRIVRAVALAMANVHAAGILHRDIKSANIMLDEQGQPVVVDFGLARTHDAATLTEKGDILGTPAYMAPEIARGDHDAAGPWSDTYSLGAVLFELLTGELPFQGRLSSVLIKVMTEPPANPIVLRKDLDARLAAICLKALAKNPEDRYGTMADMADALDNYRQEKERGQLQGDDPELRQRMAAKEAAFDRLQADRDRLREERDAVIARLTADNTQQQAQLARAHQQRADFAEAAAALSARVLMASAQMSEHQQRLADSLAEVQALIWQWAMVRQQTGGVV